MRCILSSSQFALDHVGLGLRPKARWGRWVGVSRSHLLSGHKTDNNFARIRFNDVSVTVEEISITGHIHPRVRTNPAIS